MKSKKSKIVVEKSGLIAGVNRFTCIPFTALDLSEHNMMYPAQAKRKEFIVRESANEKTNFNAETEGNILA